MALKKIHRWIAWMALALAGAAGVSAASAGPLAVVLQPHATVDTEDVHLGQIAALSGTDAALRQALAALVITAAPRPGASRTIDAALVRLCLQRHPDAPADLTLSGAEQVSVTRGHTTVSSAELERLAVDHVLAHLPYPRQDVVIRDVTAGGDLTLPRGRVSFAFRPIAGADYIGSVPLSVELAVDGKPIQHALVTVTTEVQAPVVISRRPLARYQIIEADDLMVGRMDLTRIPADRFIDAGQIVGKRAGRMIAAQTVLTGRMIETPPLVRRGDRVTIVAESGAMRITAIGEAHEQGGAGDRIAVVNLDSRRKFFARVIDGRTVAVDF